MAHRLSPAELTALLTPVFTKGASKTITGAAAAGGAVNLLFGSPHGITVPTTGYSLLMVEVTAVTGTTEANGFFIATVPDTTHITLTGTTFTNAYVSGGVLKAVTFTAGMINALTTVQISNLTEALDHAPWSVVNPVGTTLNPQP